MAAAVATEVPPPPQQVIEGRTIKMHAPPPGTLKLLPGWFEVVAGDETVKEIHVLLNGEDNEFAVTAAITEEEYEYVLRQVLKHN
mgnify:CR=1 FL=1